MHSRECFLRIDDRDGKAYTREAFVQEYGREKGMARWNASRECFQQEQHKFYVVPSEQHDKVHALLFLLCLRGMRLYGWVPV